MSCENCRYFNWQEAAKYFGHPCDVDSSSYAFDGYGCTSFESKGDENGCLRIGQRAWNPYGVSCGECNGHKHNCPRLNKQFEGFSDEVKERLIKETKGW